MEKAKAAFFLSSLYLALKYKLACCSTQIKVFHRDVSNRRMNLSEEKEQCIIFIAYLPECYGLY